jgi:hypothetical protein
MERLLLVTSVLVILLDCCPCSRLSANMDNITTGLVRVLRQLSSKPHTRVQSSNGFCLALDSPLLCLCQLMKIDRDEKLGTWKMACNAGIVPVICNLLTVCEEAAISKVLDLAVSLMRANPPGNDTQWAGRLPRETARLLTARPLVAAAQAGCRLRGHWRLPRQSTPCS